MFNNKKNWFSKKPKNPISKKAFIFSVSTELACLLIIIGALIAITTDSIYLPDETNLTQPIILFSILIVVLCLIMIGTTIYYFWRKHKDKQSAFKK